MVAYAVSPRRLSLPAFEAREGRLERAGASPFAIDQAVQVLNIADFCNACGNCTTFCPTAGAPFLDKPRIWLSRDGFERAASEAFHFESRAGSLAVEARANGRRQALELSGGFAEFRSERLRARFDAQSWELVNVEPTVEMPDNERVDLSELGPMLALLDAAAALPLR